MDTEPLSARDRRTVCADHPRPATTPPAVGPVRTPSATATAAATAAATSAAASHQGAPSAAPPAAGPPTAGTPSAGTPSAGAPSAGAPSAGTVLGALFPLLDQVGTALVVLDGSGVRVTSTSTFNRMLAAEPERATVWQAVRELAAQRASVAPCAAPAGSHVGADRHGVADRQTLTERRVSGERGAYQLLARPMDGLPRRQCDDAANGWTAVILRRVEGVVADAPAADGPASTLSRRELQVAALLARGYTTRDVAEALGISAHTTRHHIERVYEKLGVRRRAALGALIAGGGVLLGGAVPAAGRADH